MRERAYTTHFDTTRVSTINRITKASIRKHKKKKKYADATNKKIIRYTTM